MSGTNRLSSRPRASLLIAGLILMAFGASPFAANGAEKPEVKLKALLVSIDDYAPGSPSDLEYPVQSSLKLAKELLRLEYSVTFLTDPTSRLKVAPELSKFPTATLDVAESGDSLREQILSWLNGEVAPGSAQLGLLVLTGHGVERAGQPFFLGPEDSEMVGGVKIDDLRKEAAEKGAPLVIVVDACRTPTDGQPLPKQPAVQLIRNRIPGGQVDQEIKEQQGRVFKATRSPDRGNFLQSGYLYPPVLFSTTSGKTAKDFGCDLTTYLAKGLENTGESFGFTANHHMIPRPDDLQTLSLMSWFYYSITGVLRSTNLSQSCELAVGDQGDLSRIIAQLDHAGKPIKALPKINQPIDLLGLWFPEHGDYSREPLFGTAGWRFSVPANHVKAPWEPWSSGWVAPKLGGFDTAGKALFLEYQIDDPRNQLAKIPRRQFIGIDGKNAKGALAGIPDQLLLGHGEKYFCPADPNKIQFGKIPLIAGQKLNYIGISDLPEVQGNDLRLTVRGLFLADKKLTPHNLFRSPVSLLNRWWSTDTPEDKNRVLSIEPLSIPNGPVLQVHKAPADDSWRGGALLPAFWVQANDVLILEVEKNSVTEPLLLSVRLKDSEGNDMILEPKQNLKVLPQRTRLSVPIDTAGYASYFAIANPTGDFQIRNITVQRK